jgi:CHAT domain-containing protein
MNTKVLLHPILFVFSFFAIQTSVLANKEVDSLRNVLKELRASEDLPNWIKTHKNLCKVYRIQGAYKQAVVSIDNAEKNWWREPTDSLELVEWGWALVNRAYVKGEGGDFLGSKEDYASAFNVFEGLRCVNLNVVNYVYHPLANIYTRLGENEQAIQLLKVFIVRNETVENTRFIGLGYNDLGLAYLNKGDTEEALKTYKQGLNVPNASYGSLGLIASNLASLYADIHEPEKGIYYAQESIKSLKKASENQRNKGYLAGTYVTLGQLYSKQEAFVKADQNFSLAKDLLASIYPEMQHRKWGKYYLAVGNSFSLRNNFKAALDQYQSALKAVLPDFNPLNQSDLPSIDILYPEVVIIEALTNKAKTYAQFSNQQNNRTDYLDLAFQHYMLYFETEGLYRREFVDYKSKLDFIQQVHEIGESALEVTSSLYEVSKNEEWLLEGIIISERTKGIILSESIGLQQNRGQFPEGFRKFLDLKTRKESILASLKRNDLGPAQLKFLKEEELEVSRQVLQMDKSIRDKYPVLHRQLFETNRFNKSELRHIQSQLTCDLISYYFGKKHVYIFSMSKNGVASDRVEVTQKILSDMEIFRTNLTSPQLNSFAVYKSAAVSTYTTFFAGIESFLTTENVIVIPDGFLSHLPFEALAKDKGTNYKNLSYLIRDYSFYYSYSIKQLAQTFITREYESNFLGIAPGFSNSSRYAELLQSKQEVESGRLLFWGDKLLGNAASKRNFLSRAKDYRIIHLSTHAATWSEEFQQAFISFAETGTTSENHLFSSEMSTLQFSPELIILSACETGSGNYAKGEGVLSLSRLFAQTGSKNIIGSLWQVNHASNSSILAKFYTKIYAGERIHEALSNAKRGYLDASDVDALGAHPYYWSGMVLIGNNELTMNSNKGKSSSSYFVWWTLLSAGVLIISVRYFSKRRVA